MTALDPDLTRQLAEQGDEPIPLFDPVRPQHRLTARELEVAQLVTEGLTNKAIGHQLGLCEATIKACLTRIFRRLGTHHREAMVAVLLRQGQLTWRGPRVVSWLDPSPPPGHVWVQVASSQHRPTVAEVIRGGDAALEAWRALEADGLTGSGMSLPVVEALRLVARTIQEAGARSGRAA